MVNPWMLLGGLGVASPILIHILSRRRFRVVAWAAMEFLLEANRRNRRRVQLEHLILLLLRCLAMCLIALVLARPVLDAGALGPLSDGRVEHVLLLDDSPSMTLVAGNTTAFETARDALVDHLRDLATNRSGDTLTLLTTSAPDRPLAQGQILTAETVDALSARLGQLRPAATPARYDQALSALADLLRGKPGGARQATILGDLRAVDWLPTENGRGLHDPLLALRGTVDRLRLVRYGARQPENLTLAALSPPSHALTAGMESTLGATVANHGTATVEATPLRIRLGEAPPRTRLLPALGPGGSTTLDIAVLPAEPGATVVQARLPEDALPADNERLYAATVTSGARVLVVDGDPGVDPEDAESFYLVKALAPSEVVTGLRTTVLEAGAVDAAALQEARLVILLNVAETPTALLEPLRDWVRKGGGLLIALGDRIEPELLNQRLGAETGLLPGRVTTVLGDPTDQRWSTARLVDAAHPATRAFAGDRNPFLARSKIFRWWGLDLAMGPDQAPSDAPATGAAAKDGADDKKPPNGGGEAVDTAAAVARPRVLIGLDDAAESPLLVEQAVGAGRVMLLTTSADRAWNNLADYPSYVITLQEAARHLLARIPEESTLTAGEPIRLVVDPGRFKPTVRLRAPGAEEARRLIAQPQADGTLVATYDEPTRPGLYRATLTTHDGAEETRLVAVNLDATEGDLRPADESRVTALAGAAGLTILDRLEGDAGEGDVPLWRGLLIALVLVLALEQLLAWTFARRRG